MKDYCSSDEALQSFLKWFILNFPTMTWSRRRHSMVVITSGHNLNINSQKGHSRRDFLIITDLPTGMPAGRKSVAGRLWILHLQWGVMRVTFLSVSAVGSSVMQDPLFTDNKFHSFTYTVVPCTIHWNKNALFKTS